MGKWGGAQPGAGRPKGKKNKATLEKQIILDAIKQRVLKNADKLINSQLSLAQGYLILLKKVVWKEGKEQKSKLVVVEDPDEILNVMDETEGAGGVVDNNYYIVSVKAPDNKAIDSLLDRTFGKAIQPNEHSGKEGQPIVINVVKYADDGNNTTV